MDEVKRYEFEPCSEYSCDFVKNFFRKLTSNTDGTYNTVR